MGKKIKDEKKKYTDIKNIKNKKIIEQLDMLIDQIKFDLDNSSKKEFQINFYKLRQMKNIVNIIKNYDKEIKQGEDLKDIKGIGKGTINRINEILEKGRLSEIRVSKEHKKYLDQIEELEQIIGIGRKKAYELVTKYGIKSIKDLKDKLEKKEIELNDIIRMGLKYYGVYREGIPRKEIDKINKLIQEEVKKVDKKLDAIICGSYRRKKEISNDIDILLTHENIKTKLDFKSKENYLLKFVKQLKNVGFLVDDLTFEDYESKYMGFCKLKSDNKNQYYVRRIDIRYMPYNSYYTALLYFTGSRDFNTKLRNLAKELGFKLNEYGLFKIDDKKKIKIKISSEKDIFDKLGMEYLPPEKR